MSSPGPDWVEQARRFAAALAAEHTPGAGLSDVLGDLLGGPGGAHEGRAQEGRAQEGRAQEGGEQPAADSAAECRWCPLCAGLAALRGRRPDLLEALADVLTSAAGALRTSARSTADDGAAAAGAPEPTVPPEEVVPRPASAPTVQRIDVA